MEYIKRYGGSVVHVRDPQSLAGEQTGFTLCGESGVVHQSDSKEWKRSPCHACIAKIEGLIRTLSTALEDLQK